MQRRAVGLVVRRFKDVWDLQLARHSADLLRHLQRVSFTFNHARAGNEEKSGANVQTVELKCGNVGHLEKAYMISVAMASA
jgi:hypothetical protein